MGYREPGTGPRRAAGGDTEWLTLGQAAKYLGVAQSTIRKWSDLGRVPAIYTPGGHRRYRRTDLDAFLERSGPGKPARGPLVLVVDDDPQVRDRDGEHRQDEDAPAPPHDGEHESDPNPEQAEPAGVRETFEERIQPARAMVDEPALEVAIRAEQL